MQAGDVPIMDSIIVVCNDEIMLFETVSHALSYLEYWYIDECPTAYDEEGRLLKLRVSTSRKEREADPEAKHLSGVRKVLAEFTGELSDAPMVVIERAEKDPTHQEELKKVLADWLRNIAEHEATPISEDWLAQATLCELMDMGMQYSVR